ncbi:unnamed protein product [Prunus armeniaca]
MSKCSYNFKSGSVLTMAKDEEESFDKKSPHVLSTKVKLKPFTDKENYTLLQRKMKHVLKQ